MWSESAETCLQTVHAVPLVTFDPEGRVDQSVAQPGHPVGPLESDRPQSAAAIVERTLQMSVPDDAAAGEAYPTHPEDRARIALATGFEVTAQALEITGHLAQRQLQ